MVKGSDLHVLHLDERQAIGAAIEAAEAKTAGEIYCVIARKSGDYAWTTLIYGIVLAILAPLVMLGLSVNPLDLADWLTRLSNGGWSLGTGGSPHDEAGLGMVIVVCLQMSIFTLVALLGLNPDIREAMTPAFIKRQSVHKSALEQFLAHGIHLTEGRTGVLIFVSLSEHQAEIVADTAIYTKVDPGVWSEAVGALLECAREGKLAEGIIAAVEKSGAVLAKHFPQQEGDTNELPNKVVVI
jgi:putative membrane protein